MENCKECPGCERLQKLEDRVLLDEMKAAEEAKKTDERLARGDTQFAVINTKLSAILWGIGIIGAALIGVLVKFLFPF